jgi:ATP-dependent Lon protease
MHATTGSLRLRRIATSDVGRSRHRSTVTKPATKSSRSEFICRFLTQQESGEEKYVGVPEQGGRNLIAADPLAPGTVYGASISADGTVGLARIEVTVAAGTGKLKLAGGVSGDLKEAVNRAFGYLQANKGGLGIGADLDRSDLHVEVIDLLGNKAVGDLGVAFHIAAYSALRKSAVQPGMIVIGDMSIQGNIKPARSLVEPLRVAMDNGAKRALIPIENKRSFLEVPPDVIEQVDPVFFGDPKQAAFKALGIS